MKSNHHIYLFLLTCFIAVLSLAGCNPKGGTTNTTSTDSIENFDKFYDQFHKDSIFQMTRIQFPLAGGISDGQGEEKWTKKNWIPLKMKITEVDTTEYKTSSYKTDSLYSEKIWLNNSGFWQEYTFKLIDKKWFLVYAEDSNN